MDRKETTVRWSSTTIPTEIDGEVSIYAPASETVVILNGTASDIWRLCDGTNTVAETVKILASAYRVDASAISDEVTEVIDDLIRQGFLQQGA